MDYLIREMAIDDYGEVYRLRKDAAVDSNQTVAL